MEGKLNTLKDALKGTDVAAIKAASDELQKAFYDISAKLYQQAGPQANPGAGYDPNAAAGGSANNGGNGQDYYDADYEVVDDDKK